MSTRRIIRCLRLQGFRLVHQHQGYTDFHRFQVLDPKTDTQRVERITLDEAHPKVLFLRTFHDNAEGEELYTVDTQFTSESSEMLTLPVVLGWFADGRKIEPKYT